MMQYYMPHFVPYTVAHYEAEIFLCHVLYALLRDAHIHVVTFRCEIHFEGRVELCVVKTASLRQVRDPYTCLHATAVLTADR